ncbi:pyridine nucleotide-disulfide oxidoreductase [Rhodopseudomonas sp. AAP120]|uniref:FAD-dependent oxidoreductase n=1 Tax=Rhodopseudomonas sp. AAP120 TaxID=1523430 RepID=UPI0006B9B675|nr:FAD-dependent oxidoreductase [Rhodopseudomonas sp. AAP120]KPF99333.1 pyridine nucleotide-disulfide oxidoreductase [Rhodopseudomonas sp. AAP120]
MSSPFHVAVVGSGPSGFYAAEALLRSGAAIAVDMFERLPVPYGLVRFGVAPDHPKLKLVSLTFDKIAALPGFNFIGGVAVGEDVTIDEMRSAYDAVVLATGADLSRPLGIPGEALPGCYSAGEFVAWYNGHPNHRDRSFDLSHEVATVIGHGNVALDVARILSKTVDELRHTDIATHALDVLAESRVREVHVVGRGGPTQAKFGAKELRDFLSLAQCDAVVDPRELATVPDAAGDPEQDEKLSLLRSFAQQAPAKPRRCLFRFGLAPVEIQGEQRVEAIRFAGQDRTAEQIACGAVFSSIGRRTAPLDGVPYDAVRGVHANVDGRITRGDQVVQGLYVCGWSKRGPSGTIGTNRACGMATADAVLADLATGAPRFGNRPDALLGLLRTRVPRLISYQDWGTIDAEEKRRGAVGGRPRDKFVRVSEMIATLDSSVDA